jgi:hypothetical protein
MSALVKLINYQLFYPFLSLEIKCSILENNGHFTPELLICAVGDLTMHNLAYTTSLLEFQPPTFVVSMKISFISLFFVLGWKFASVWLLPFIIYVTLSILHDSQASQGSAKWNLFLLVGCSHGFRDLWSNPLLPFTKSFLNGRLQGNLWRMA